MRNGSASAMAALARALPVVALLAGCAAPPPPPPPTVVNISLMARPDANKGPDGDAAPVELRVYQLAAPANFNNAAFFELYHGDTATLTTDLIKRDGFMLNPGQTKSMTLMCDPPVHAIGILAAYRDYQNVAWRGTADIVAHRTTNIVVAVGAAGVTVNSVLVPAAPTSK